LPPSPFTDSSGISRLRQSPGVSRSEREDTSLSIGFSIRRDCVRPEWRDASFVRPYPTPQSIPEPANSASCGHFHLSPQRKVRASPFACRPPDSPPIFRCECCVRWKHVWCHEVKWFCCPWFTTQCVYFHHLVRQFWVQDSTYLSGWETVPSRRPIAPLPSFHRLCVPSHADFVKTASQRNSKSARALRMLLTACNLPQRASS
jgi:hypothetical protein